MEMLEEKNFRGFRVWWRTIVKGRPLTIDEYIRIEDKFNIKK